MQSRLESLIESLVNIVVGLGLAVVLNWAYLASQGFEVNAGQMTELGLIMTVASLVRSYLLRRFFNRRKREKIVDVGSYSPGPGRGVQD